MPLQLPLVAVLLLSASAPRPAELGGNWPAAASGKTVTVEAKNANQAIREIAGAAGWGLALSSGPSGEAAVEFSFKAVPVEDALAAVLYASKLHAVRIGDTISVTPADGSGSQAAEENGSGSEPDQGPAAPFLKHKHHRLHHHGNDRVQMGHDVEIAPGEKVGDVVAVGGSVHIGKGATADDVIAVGGHIETDGDAQISGDAVAIGGDAHFASGTIVSGDTVTVGGAVVVDEGATVAGQQINLGLRHMFESDHPFWSGGWLILFWVRKLAEFVLYFCLGALLVLAAPAQLAAIESYLMRQPLRAGLGGFLATLAIPILTVLLVVTLVGIPLVAVEFFAIALAAVMGFTAMSVLIGNRLRIPVRGGGLLGLAVGTAIVVALESIPFLGGVILVTGWFLALGSALGTRYGSLQQA